MSMDPSMIAALAAQEAQQATRSVGEPAWGDVEAFANAMAAKSAKPEQALVNGVQKVSQTSAMKPEVVGGLGDNDMLATLELQAMTQKQIRDMTTLSKVLGAAATGINKLTSMQ
jgi:hypothetical protein